MSTSQSSHRSDAELVAESLAGRIGAFGHIVERYQNLVCSVAYAAIGDLALSEDVSQETFIAAWKALAGLEEPDKLRSWLCGTARNLGKMARRTRTRRHRRGLESENGAKPSLLDDLLAREEVELLDQALATIPRIYRESLVLFYREEQSTRQVAVGLGITEEAVRQRLARGRRSLSQEVVARFEKMLPRTRPGKSFAVAVLASLGAAAGRSATAAAATATNLGSAASAATATNPGTAASPVAKSALLLGLALGASLAGVLLYLLAVGGESPAIEFDAAHASGPSSGSPSLASWHAPGFKTGSGSIPSAAASAIPKYSAKNPAFILEVADLLGGSIAGAVVLELTLDGEAEVGRTGQDGRLRLSSSPLAIAIPRYFASNRSGHRLSVGTGDAISRS